jgi:hypothetical protein
LGKRLSNIVLAVLSLLIYGSTVLTLPEVTNSSSCCEQWGIAAAISNLKYAAPIGSLYSGVLDFLEKRATEPLALALDDAQSPGGFPSAAPGTLNTTMRDGNSVGYALFCTAAFRLFGIHAWALQAMMLLLMALSAGAFLWRFPRGSPVVTLYFSVLNVMLFTILVWDPEHANQIMVAGVRYLSLVSVLPAFHILLTVIEPRPWGDSASKSSFALLAIQTAIFLLILLVRGSTLPITIATAIVCATVGWLRRRKPPLFRALLGNAAIMSSVGVAGFIAIAVKAPSDYFVQGRIMPDICERVTVGLAVNPAWPFPGVNDMFDCKKFISTGIEPGISDKNAHCIWFDYASKHHIPLADSPQWVLGRTYERAQCLAFVKIAARNPADVFQTFVYYKPTLLVATMAKSMSFHFQTSVWLALLLASLAVSLISFIAGETSSAEILHIGGIAVLMMLFWLPTYLAAWAAPHLIADLLFYCLFLLGLSTAALLVSMRALFVPENSLLKAARSSLR